MEYSGTPCQRDETLQDASLAFSNHLPMVVPGKWSNSNVLNCPKQIHVSTSAISFTTR